MSFSRATSEAPAVPPPRSPVHHAAKEPLRYASPVPPITSNGKSLTDLPPKSIASVLSPPQTSKPLLAEKERELSPKPPVVAAAERKVHDPTPEPEPELEPGDVIDMETFEQILELDEDETHDFSYGMVVAYFSQASQTFTDMDNALKAEELDKLSALGHFLKGSSAALGVTKVQATCEIIQHLGKMQEDERKITQPEALRKLAPLLSRVKKEYLVAEAWLRNYYEEAGVKD